MGDKRALGLPLTPTLIDYSKTQLDFFGT